MPEDEKRAQISARCKRVCGMREALKLSRREFTSRFGVSAATLQHWENPLDEYGLTEKGARRLVKALQSSDIRSTLEWWLHGIGDSPEIPNNLLSVTAVSSARIRAEAEVSNTIEQELQFFYKLHRKATHAVIKDDSMLPHYAPGDYVAGIKYQGDEIANAVDKHCIVVTDEGQLLVRHVSESSTPTLYTLRCTHFDSQQVKPILYDVKLVSVAPIIWIRREVY